jgi:hypothetical protein
VIVCDMREDERFPGPRAVKASCARIDLSRKMRAPRFE